VSTLEEETSGARAQTLSRGVRILEELAAVTNGLTIAELAAALGVHRSIAYRLVRTLEDHRLVRRNGNIVELGVGLTELARGATRKWEDLARSVVRTTADALAMTTYISVQDGSDCVVLMSEEPLGRQGTVTYRLGYRHRLDAGADGKVIQSELSDTQWSRISSTITRSDKIDAIHRNGFATSTGEVIPGVSAVAAPIRLRTWGAAALAAVYVESGTPVDVLAESLNNAARQIERGI
jgi:DNA-binding IclR family transcriptional regulator